MARDGTSSRKPIEISGFHKYPRQSRINHSYGRIRTPSDPSATSSPSAEAALRPWRLRRGALAPDHVVPYSEKSLANHRFAMHLGHAMIAGTRGSEAGCREPL